MTKEDKELLLKDLCGRLPYGVKVQSYRHGEDDVETIETLYEIDSDGYMSTLECETLKPISKPYLFPLSTMTKEQNKEYAHILVMCSNLANCQLLDMTVEDWFRKNHFDYRGLIPMGSAIDATGLNIY